MELSFRGLPKNNQRSIIVSSLQLALEKEREQQQEEEQILEEEQLQEDEQLEAEVLPDLGEALNHPVIIIEYVDNDTDADILDYQLAEPNNLDELNQQRQQHEASRLAESKVI